MRSLTIPTRCSKIIVVFILACGLICGCKSSEEETTKFTIYLLVFFFSIILLIVLVVGGYILSKKNIRSNKKQRLILPYNFKNFVEQDEPRKKESNCDHSRSLPEQKSHLQELHLSKALKAISENRIKLNQLSVNVKEIESKISVSLASLNKSMENYVLSSTVQESMASIDSKLLQNESKLQNQVSDIENVLSNIQAQLKMIQQETQSENRILAASAKRNIQSHIKEVEQRLKDDGGRLFNAISYASQAKTIPDIFKAGERMLSEFLSVEDCRHFKLFDSAIRQFNSTLLEIDLIAEKATIKPQQEINRILDEAQQMMCKINDMPEQTIPVELLEQMRSDLIKEIGISYIGIIMKRFEGDEQSALSILSELMSKLELKLINITVGQTRPDVRYHDVASSSPSDCYPSGVIINVVKMGYVDRISDEVCKARVIVSE